jgi:hypothetical protein
MRILERMCSLTVARVGVTPQPHVTRPRQVKPGLGSRERIQCGFRADSVELPLRYNQFTNRHHSRTDTKAGGTAGTCLGRADGTKVLDGRRGLTRLSLPWRCVAAVTAVTTHFISGASGLRQL